MKKLLIGLVTTSAIISACSGVGGSTRVQEPPLFAYVGNFDYLNPLSTLSRCKVDLSNGNLTDCTTINPTTSSNTDALRNPTGITRTTIAGVNYLYINSFGNPATMSPNIDSRSTRCVLNQTDGLLSSCMNVAFNNFDWPIGVKINNGYAYIPNYGSTAAGNSYTKCSVNQSNGTLSDCQNFIPKNASNQDVLYSPEDIAIYQTTSGNSIAYIPNQQFVGSESSSSYAQCTISKTDGTLTDCSRITPSAPGALIQPRGVTIDNGYIYFADSAANGNNSLLNSGYTQCRINANSGDLTDCATTKLPGILNSPTGIAIKVVDAHRYAYITNEDGMNYVKCDVSETTGTFSNCNANSFGITPTTAVTYIDFSR